MEEHRKKIFSITIPEQTARALDTILEKRGIVFEEWLGGVLNGAVVGEMEIANLDTGEDFGEIAVRDRSTFFGALTFAMQLASDNGEHAIAASAQAAAKKDSAE